MNLKKTLAFTSLFFFVSSCTCGVPLRVTSIQRSDKKLACKDVILEINEAEHYRSQAGQEKGIGMGESLMPLCWVSGYVDGDKAIKTANARIDYLGHIYDLMDCGGADRKKMPLPQPIIVPVPTAPPPPPRPAPVAAPVQNQRGEAYYKLKKNLGPDEMHEHRDKRRKLYIHSHKHNGPHRHLEDE